MNFLAHLALSDDDDDLMLGNFIADSVRSAQWEGFKPMVVEGIKLHHKIDFFTDNHPTVDKSKDRLRSRHHKYSGVIVDILYDHFLAKHFEDYKNKALPKFAEEAYALLYRRWDELPHTVQHMLPYMESGNWLVNYGNREGLTRVFKGMSRRASFDNRMDEAADDLFLYYEDYEEEFREFFPLLQDYVQQEINSIPSTY